MPDDWRALDLKGNHSTFSRRRGEATHPALQDSVSRTQSSPSLAYTHRGPSLPDISDSEGLATEGMSPLDTWCSASSDGESEHQHVQGKHSTRRSLLGTFDVVDLDERARASRRRSTSSSPSSSTRRTSPLLNHQPPQYSFMSFAPPSSRPSSPVSGNSRRYGVGLDARKQRAELGAEFGNVGQVNMRATSVSLSPDDSLMKAADTWVTPTSPFSPVTCRGLMLPSLPPPISLHAEIAGRSTQAGTPTKTPSSRSFSRTPSPTTSRFHSPDTLFYRYSPVEEVPDIRRAASVSRREQKNRKIEKSTRNRSTNSLYKDSDFSLISLDSSTSQDNSRNTANSDMTASSQQVRMKILSLVDTPVTSSIRNIAGKRAASLKIEILQCKNMPVRHGPQVFLICCASLHEGSKFQKLHVLSKVDQPVSETLVGAGIVKTHSLLPQHTTRPVIYSQTHIADFCESFTLERRYSLMPSEATDRFTAFAHGEAEASQIPVMDNLTQEPVDLLLSVHKYDPSLSTLHKHGQKKEIIAMAALRVSPGAAVNQWFNLTDLDNRLQTGSNGLSSAIRVAIYFAEEQVTEQMHAIELSKPRMGTTEKRQTKISEWQALGGKWEGGRDWCVNEDGTWSPIKAPQFTLGIDSPGFASTQPPAQSLTGAFGTVRPTNSGEDAVLRNSKAVSEARTRGQGDTRLQSQASSRPSSPIVHLPVGRFAPITRETSGASVLGSVRTDPQSGPAHRRHLDRWDEKREKLMNRSGRGVEQAQATHVKRLQAKVRRALVFNWYAAMQIRFSKVLTTVQLHHHEPARIPQSPPVSARMEVKSEVRKPHSISVAGYTELPSPPLLASPSLMVAKGENGGERGGGGGEVHRRRGDVLSSESHATPRQQLEGLFKQVDDVSTNLKTSPVSTRDFSFITEEGVTIHDESTAYCLPPGGGSGTSGQGKNKMSEASRDIARYILSATKDLSATTDLARKAESNPSKIGCSAWTDRKFIEAEAFAKLALRLKEHGYHQDAQSYCSHAWDLLHEVSVQDNYAVRSACILQLLSEVPQEKVLHISTSSKASPSSESETLQQHHVSSPPAATPARSHKRSEIMGRTGSDNISVNPPSVDGETIMTLTAQQGQPWIQHKSENNLVPRNTSENRQVSRSPFDNHGLIELDSPRRPCGSVDINITLCLDMIAAGVSGSRQREAFEEVLIKDLSNASGHSLCCFQVIRMQAGSIIALIRIAPDASKDYLDPFRIAVNLQQQVFAVVSPLSSGVITCHCENIEIIDPRDETAPERNAAAWNKMGLALDHISTEHDRHHVDKTLGERANEREIAEGDCSKHRSPDKASVSYSFEFVRKLPTAEAAALMRQCLGEPAWTEDAQQLEASVAQQHQCSRSKLMALEEEVRLAMSGGGYRGKCVNKSRSRSPTTSRSTPTRQSFEAAASMRRYGDRSALSSASKYNPSKSSSSKSSPSGTEAEERRLEKVKSKGNKQHASSHALVKAGLSHEVNPKTTSPGTSPSNQDPVNYRETKQNSLSLQPRPLAQDSRRRGGCNSDPSPTSTVASISVATDRPQVSSQSCELFPPPPPLRACSRRTPIVRIHHTPRSFASDLDETDDRECFRDDQDQDNSDVATCDTRNMRHEQMERTPTFGIASSKTTTEHLLDMTREQRLHALQQRLTIPQEKARTRTGQGVESR